MAQTPMQELLKWHRKSMRSYSETNKMIEVLLEKEKEQTINFHIMLMKNGLQQEGSVIDWNYDELKQEALKFYNQTYNQNK